MPVRMFPPPQMSNQHSQSALAWISLKGAAIALLRASVACLAMQASLAPAEESAASATSTTLPGRRSVARDLSKANFNLQRPSWVYDNWGIYDPIREMPVTESLALKQIEEIVRLKRDGVRFDYYMMNAFWFESGTGYRKWDSRYWPNGPDRWIAACRANGLIPGLWFACNLIQRTGTVPAWQDSYGGDDYRPYGPDMDGALSLFEGGFLPDFMLALQHWYDRGIRLFEFDMADLNAATPSTRRSLSNREIRQRNKDAFIAALAAFRQRNPDAILVGFNGFKGLDRTSTDLDWLGVFATLFSGDIRVSDLPVAHYFRSMDLFNDNRGFGMVHAGVPLNRIDPCGVVLSHNVFGIFRKSVSWKSMVLQAAARGAWKNTVYGALEEIKSGEDARWFARVQKLYEPLMSNGRTRIFGGMPEEAKPYGYVSFANDGTIYTVVNPAQAVSSIPLEHLPRNAGVGRVLFRDAGFAPILDKGTLTLGPGQMAVVGFGRFSGKEHDFGVQSDGVIPKRIEPYGESFRQTGAKTLEVTFVPPIKGDLRIVFQQRSPEGKPLRLVQYPVPTDPLAEGPIPETGLKIEAWQPGFSLPVVRDQRTSAPGISWGLGEVRQDSLVPGRPLTIRCTSADKRAVLLEARIYTVEY